MPNHRTQPNQNAKEQLCATSCPASGEMVVVFVFPNLYSMSVLCLIDYNDVFPS
jgi:hypothetical protein